MMGIADNIPVTLVIKAPSQRMADQTVECLSNWTIKKLKQHLETVYPSKPKHNEQRLIYSGRLLQDHLTLKEILRQYDSSEQSSKHTVHLVCSMPSEPAPFQLPKENDVPPVSSQSVTNSVSQPDGLRHRTASLSSGAQDANIAGASMYSTYQPGANVPLSTAGYEYTPEQYAAMLQQQQQFYSQYMMQYMQYYQSAFYPYQSFNPQASVFPQAFIPPAVHPQAAVNGHPQAAVNGQPPAPGGQAEANNNQRAAPARQNMRMNAQGGMEEDDEEDGEPHDWLHHVYFFMRFLTFVGILFFYSNVSRFLMVFLGSFAFYLLQNLRKYMQRRGQEHQRQAAVAADQANNQQAEPAPDIQNNQDGQQGGNAHSPERASEPAEGLQEPPQDDRQQEQPQVDRQQDQPQVDQQQDQPQVDQQQEQPQVDQQQGQEQPERRQGDNAEEGRLARMFVFTCNTVQAFFTSLVPAPPELLEVN